MSNTIRQLKKLFVANENISIVFFVGKGKTHRKVFNFRRIVGLLGSLTFILLAGSIGLISSSFLKVKSSRLSTELQERKSQLLSYQAQYENLFEIAYGLVERPDEIEENVIVDDHETENWQPNITSPEIYFKYLNLKPDESGSIVSFSIVNNTNDLQEGIVWAIAKINQDDGSPYYLSAPEPGMVFNKDGSVLDFKLGKKFKFKKQWNTILKLDRPQNISGKMTYITIYIADLNGSIKLRQTLQPIAIPTEPSVSH